MKGMLVGLFVFFILSGPAAAEDENERQAREVYSQLLSDPKRDSWQLPDRVVQSLALKANEVVAEIGNDNDGYFARRIARFVSAIYVLNSQAAVLDSYKKEAPTNQQTFVSALGDFQEGGKPVDTVFLYNTYAAIPARPLFLGLLNQALRPQGRIVVIDFFKNGPPPGLPPSQQITQSLVVSEMKAAGFRLTQSFDFLPLQFFLVFQR
jgi:hypothetical protein